MKGDWNSKQYMKFGNERTQPSVDLINRIGIEAKNILDIGCGPGNSTNALAERFPGAEVTGVDSSDDMLASARKKYPELTFKKCTVPDGLDMEDESLDLIFSNACLHWIPQHEKLLPALMKKLKPGGWLAVQIPLTDEAEFYRLLYRTLDEKRWEKIRNIRNFHNLTPEKYYDLISGISSVFDIWQTVYYHTAEDFGGVLDWYRGSGLRPYLEALSEDGQKELCAELLEKIPKHYYTAANGKVILKMPRLFFVAERD